MILAAIFCGALLATAEAPVPVTDGEVWNEGVEYFRTGDVTNALRVLRPLILSKTHGARAAEVVAKLEYDRGNLEEAAEAAQIALRAAPEDAKANRNFTRATDGIPRLRETKRVNAILQAAQGKDPGSMMLAATKDARALMDEAAGFRTNVPARAVALSDALERRTSALADTWIALRETISRSVTNEEQAATVLQQIEQAEAKTKKAAKEFGDLDANAYASMSDVEHDFTRFLKLTAQPPAALDEGLRAQSNAWQDVEAFNGRDWQQDALDYTRAFRAKFPAWAQDRERRAQSDTNMPPFTREAQAKISALATEVEKLQIECCTKSLPPEQEKAIGLLNQIRELLPEDGKGGGGQNQQNQQNDKNQQKQDQQQQQQQQQNDQQNESDQKNDQPQEEDPPERDASESPEKQDDKEDQEIEATLRKAQERNDEHEAEKKARMRKAQLPPNERDW